MSPPTRCLSKFVSHAELNVLEGYPNSAERILKRSGIPRAVKDGSTDNFNEVATNSAPSFF